MVVDAGDGCDCNTGLAFAIVTVSGVKGIVALVVFMVACWGCTYFGMHLMHHPRMSEKHDLTKPE